MAFVYIFNFIDEAIQKIDLIRKFLRQRTVENADILKTLELAVEISGIEIPLEEIIEESAGETVSI